MHPPFSKTHQQELGPVDDYTDSKDVIQVNKLIRGETSSTNSAERGRYPSKAKDKVDGGTQSSTSVQRGQRKKLQSLLQGGPASSNTQRRSGAGDGNALASKENTDENTHGVEKRVHFNELEEPTSSLADNDVHSVSSGTNESLQEAKQMHEARLKAEADGVPIRSEDQESSESPSDYLDHELQEENIEQKLEQFADQLDEIQWTRQKKGVPEETMIFDFKPKTITNPQEEKKIKLSREELDLE